MTTTGNDDAPSKTILDWSVPQYCVDCRSEMRRAKSVNDGRPPHYAKGRCNRCYNIAKTPESVRRHDWSVPRHCKGCKRRMRPGNAPSDGETVKHFGGSVCINCAAVRARTLSGSKTRVPIVFDEYGQVCKHCDRHLPFEKYPKQVSSPTGRRSKCFRCGSLWGHYRLTYAEYMDLLVSQGNACAGCRSPVSDGKDLVVDHDHNCCSTEYTCGECVRGLLCSPCNIALGQVHDSVEKLEKLINYLKETK